MCLKMLLLTYLICILTYGEVNSHGTKNTGETPLVSTPLGQMKGFIITSRLGRAIYSFIGIRYAKAPVEGLRFKPPVPVEKWDQLYDATKNAPVCPQPNTDPISEDCLFLNVYSTKLPKGSENPKRPVIVHIHAGGFYSVGSPTYWAGPEYFMDQDIVLVTFNYRLATLGFLSTGKESPGNYGLKDQVEVLRWVKKNIAAFGGDPDNVTIMGYSAGAWSVNLHMVSPMSTGLFHKAIAMSGSAVGIWKLPSNQLEIAKKQARFVGCPDDTSENVVKCLKTASSKDLGDSLPKFREFGYDPILIWSPVVESDYGQERFLPADPVSLIKSGNLKKVPFITGITEDEFGYEAFSIVDNETLAKEMSDNFEKVYPITFIYERDTNRSKIVSKALRSFYFHDNPVDKSQFTNLADLYADSIVGFNVNRAARLIAKYSDANVFYYRFSYHGRYSHFYLPGTNNTVPYGVVHHDDLIYLFYISTLFPLFKKDSPREVEMVAKLTKIYANFAKTGKPIPVPSELLGNVKWEPFTLESQKYLDIGSELVLKEKMYEERYAEWDKLFPL